MSGRHAAEDVLALPPRPHVELPVGHCIVPIEALGEAYRYGALAALDEQARRLRADSFLEPHACLEELRADIEAGRWPGDE